MEIQDLITNSFLSETDQQILQQILQTEGDSANFYDKFEKILKKEITARAAKTELIGETYNKATQKIEHEYIKTRQQLEKDLAKQLASANDWQAKEEIWDEYYINVELAQKDYYEKLQQVTEKNFISAIKEI